MRLRPAASDGCCRRQPSSSGYTLVEVLIATTLALMLMAAVAQMFSQLGTSVNNSRATLETADRLRGAALRLQMDLDSLTVTTLPPRRVESEEGYVEIRKGGVHETNSSCPAPTPINRLTNNSSDSSFTLTTSGNSQVAGTVGEVADILMFTTRNSNRPFSGLYNNSTIQSETAEVAWFMRGHNLYRRVLLVAPGLSVSGAGANFYNQNDISVHSQNGSLTANTLGDLTRRECRFGHAASPFPFSCYWGALGLPTLADSFGGPGSTPAPQSLATLDYWNQALNGQDPITGSSPAANSRTDDLILTNVIGFDVKVWDPGAGAYVDLCSSGGGNPAPSPAAVTFASSSVNSINTSSGAGAADGGLPYYDTWSTSYENTGIGNPAKAGQGTNGFDVNNTGVVGSPGDALTGPPFLAPLRGIQVKIRVFEPDSRAIREVTVTADFLPK